MGSRFVYPRCRCQEAKMLRKKHRLLLLATALISITTLITPGAQYARATSDSKDKSNEATGAPQAPLAWTSPFAISVRSGYHSQGLISASPVNGTADVLWGLADGGAGAIIRSSNTAVAGAFTDLTVKNGEA